ncbi:MAG: hypothetical protein ACUVWP_05625 [bacterium]
MSEGKGVISDVILNEGKGLSIESIISQMENRGYTRLLDIAYACHLVGGGERFSTLRMELTIHSDGTARGYVIEEVSGSISVFVEKIMDMWLFGPFDGTKTTITFNYSFSNIALERGKITIGNGKEVVEEAVLNECVDRGYIAELNTIYAVYRSKKDSVPIRGIYISFDIMSDGSIQNGYVVSACPIDLSVPIEKAINGWRFSTHSLKPIGVIYNFMFDSEIK